MPCRSKKGCVALIARARLASGERMSDVERSSVDIEAKGCQGPQSDPWEKGLTWPECAGQAAFKRPDIQAALTLRALSSMAPLHNWPDGYVAGPVETWSTIEGLRTVPP